MKNPFSQNTRMLFVGKYDCSKCGMNQSLELHHILGRCSDSPLNAATMCRRCHTGLGHFFSKEQQSIFLNKTLLYLIFNGYKLNKKDKDFIKKFKEFYDEDTIKQYGLL